MLVLAKSLSIQKFILGKVSLTRKICQTGILFGFFVSILFAFINASIFVKRAKIPSSLFRINLCWIRSEPLFLKMSVS